MALVTNGDWVESVMGLSIPLTGLMDPNRPEELSKERLGDASC